MTQTFPRRADGPLTRTRTRTEDRGGPCFSVADMPQPGRPQPEREQREKGGEGQAGSPPAGRSAPADRAPSRPQQGLGTRSPPHTGPWDWVPNTQKAQKMAGKNRHEYVHHPWEYNGRQLRAGPRGSGP